MYNKIDYVHLGGGASSSGPFPSLSSLLPLQVSLHREFLFRNSKQNYYGVPVIASNMDTVGTFESAVELAKVSLRCVVAPGYQL